MGVGSTQGLRGIPGGFGHSGNVSLRQTKMGKHTSFSSLLLSPAILSNGITSIRSGA